MTSVLERPAATGGATGGMSVAWIDPHSLTPDPNNERGVISLERDPELEGLIASIREVGVKEPLLVYRQGGHTYIKSGHRRHVAALLIGLANIPCVVMQEAPTPAQGEIDRLVSNAQRRDIDDISKARTIKRILDDHPAIKQGKLASMLGMSQPAVSNLLRLLALPDPAIKLIEAGTLSAGHGIALLALHEDDGCYKSWGDPIEGQETREDALLYMVGYANGAGGPVSVRQLEETIRQHNAWCKDGRYRYAERIQWAEERAAREASSGGSEAPSLFHTPEEREAIEAERRRKALAEGRVRMARVRTAYRTMHDLVAVPKTGPSLEHLKLAALAVVQMRSYMNYYDREPWEEVWGGVDKRNVTEVRKQLDQATTVEEVLAIMAQAAVYLIGVEHSGKELAYGEINKYAEKLWGMKGHIKAALEQGEEAKQPAKSAKSKKGEGRD